MTTANYTTANLPTENQEWGFWGTTKRALDNGHEILGGGEPHPADFALEYLWDRATDELRDVHGLDAGEARDFLDSTAGRHIADNWLGCQAYTGPAPAINSYGEQKVNYDLDLIAGLPGWTSKSVRGWEKSRAANGSI